MNKALDPEIIAEAGSNHNGSPERAKELIDSAAEAEASSVKFQFIFAEGLYLPKFFDGKSYIDNSVFTQRQAEEITFDQWKDIWSYANDRGIAVSASVFCGKGIELLSSLGSPYVKIASTDLTNHDLIGQACATFDRVIVSTGMATLQEVAAMVGFVNSTYPGTDLQLMHCVSAYPCSLVDANVQRVTMLKGCFGLPVGYSDHTEGEVSASMALAQGVRLFEKHFTTDRTLPGFDHQHALDGAGLISYVNTLRDGAASLSRPANTVCERERTTKLRARRGVYAARDLPQGHVLTSDDLLFVRPSTEFEANGVSTLVGTRLEAPIPQYAALGLGRDAGMVPSNWQAAEAYWGREMQEKGMSVRNGPKSDAD